MNTDHTQLKKFAVRSRECLLAVTDEQTAYTGFMRLCAAAYVSPVFLQECAGMSVEERRAAFEEKCAQLAEVYGGIFTLNGSIIVPDILLTDIFSGIQEISLCGSDVLGWLHQYYNEPYRHSLAAGLKKSKRLPWNDIAAATQVFTPEWIVRYLVENTLVRKWYEGGGKRLAGYDSYIPGYTASAAYTPPCDITFLDPCTGSGNILLYAFDVFMEMYRACGYADDTAACLILEKNLYGLELDSRACAVAETALRIRAAAYGAYTSPNIFSFSDEGISSFAGSLAEADECSGGARSVLSGKYDIVATNPPYLGHSAMDSRLLSFVQEKYPGYSTDLFVTFAVRSYELVRPEGKLGFLTPCTWLFIKTCEPFRRLVLGEKCLESLVQLEYSAFDEAVVPLCMFTFSNSPADRECHFLRLTDHDGDMETQNKRLLEGAADRECSYRYCMKGTDFLDIPSAPVVYWLSDNARKCFGMRTLGDMTEIREGLITGDNEHFLRYWYEVGADRTAFRRTAGKKWYLLNKGGDFRRWYGNREYVIDWEDDGRRIRDFRDGKGRLRSRPQNLEFCFRRAVSWSSLTSGELSVRYYDENFMFNVAGSCAFADDDRQLMWLLALLNSKVTAMLAQAVNPTMNMNPGDTARLPVPEYREMPHISGLAEECADICRQDWDSFETSMDFRRHPLI